MVGLRREGALRTRLRESAVADAEQAGALAPTRPPTLPETRVVDSIGRCLQRIGRPRQFEHEVRKAEAPDGDSLTPMDIR